MSFLPILFTVTSIAGLEISISPTLRVKKLQPHAVSTVRLLYTVKETGDLSILCPEISTKLYVNEFGFWSNVRLRCSHSYPTKFI
jgi:hypothetical protein